jgi:hypothetical protein
MYGRIHQLADIRGIAMWVSNHIIAKPVTNKLSYGDAVPQKERDLQPA